MSKRLRSCLSVFLCIVLVMGLNPAQSIALTSNSSASSAGSQQVGSEDATSTAKVLTENAGAAAAQDAVEPAASGDVAQGEEPAAADASASGAASEPEADSAAAAKDADASSASSDANDKAAASSAASNGNGAADREVRVLAAGTARAAATYAAVTSDRDITNNLLNPEPEAKFKDTDNNYYSVDQLKQKYGEDYKIYVGDSVWIAFNYKNVTNVKADEALTFPVPEGVDGNDATVKGIIQGPGGSEQGKYWLADGLIHMQFSEEYIASITGGSVSDGYVNFYGTVSESALEKPGIIFGGVNIAPIEGHVSEDPNQKAAVKKWNGTPESTTETTYDAAKNAEQFTIEIDTTGNTKPVDIDVTDVVKFEPANVIDNNKAWTVDTDEAANAGLTTSFTKDSNGKYVWSIKQMPANTKYKLTYWVYLDSANSTGNFSFTNEATPAIGNQTFNPAKTDGMEKHQFSVDKRVATNVSYDPTTGKATATYEVKVTANANNSGTATNVSVVDTFKTGGKYVTDVKQTSSVGTISDKAQSDDSYSFKWNIGSIAPGETKTLTYTAEFDPNTLYFGADQGSKDRKDINNEAKVYEGDDTTPRATASASQRVDNQQATKGYEFDTATGKLKFTIVFNGKIPGTNKYFDSVLTNFTDQIQTAGVTYADDTPVLEAFTDAGIQKTATLTDANIAGNSSFNIAIPSDMKGPYSYRLTYYVNVPDNIDPSTVIRNKMVAQGVGINGTSPFSLSDEASATVADTYAASLSKGVNYAQVLGSEGEYDRIEWNLTLTSPVPAGATITDVADNWNKNFPNVFNNGDMMDSDVTKLCLMNGNSIASTLERGVDYDLTWEGSQMVLTFLKPVTGISKDNPLRFFYRTQLVPTDDMYASMSQPTFPKGDSDHSFNGLDYCSAGNKATLNVNGMTATADNRTTVNGGFEKYNGTYDSKTREIQWKAGLYYNSHNGYVIQGERTITENIAPDQVISRVTDPNGNEVPYTVSADGRTVTFKVNWSPNNQNDFVYVYTKMNEQYLIEHGQDPDHLVDYEVTNTASIDGFGTQVAVGATAKVNETGTLNKTSSYTPEIEQAEGGPVFTLDVNPNASNIDPEKDTLTILDKMNRNLVLDVNSVRINGQTVTDFGNNAQLIYEKNSNHFELVIPDEMHCTITYTAKIVGCESGEDGWLSNTAQIEGRPGKATLEKLEQKRYTVGAGAFSSVPLFVKKLDGNSDLVSGATFELKSIVLDNGQLKEVDAYDSNGELISTTNDNLDGTYRWINLLKTTDTTAGASACVYVIREIAAPTGCELDSTPKYVYFKGYSPSQEMTDAMTAAGIQATEVNSGGGNNVEGMFSFKDSNLDEKVDVTVNKDWNDEDNAEGFRPNEITINLIRDHNVENPAQTVQVKAGTDGNWSYTFTGLDKYETVDSTRHECTYTVTEDAVPEYTTVVSGSAADGYTVTNSHTVAKTSIQGLKFWNDDSDAAGKRPGKITVGVFADDSEQPLETKEITAADNASAVDPNYWTYTFDNLNKYKDDGQRTPIVYTVKEIGSVAGYEAEQTGAADNNYTIKNKFVGKTIYVDKVDDEGNPVPGAELMVESVNGDGGDEGGDEGGLEPEALDDGTTTTIATWTTDGTKHELTLAPGKYVLSEGTTPAGYQTADPIYFTVNEDGTVTGPDGVVSGDDLNIITMTDARMLVSVTVTKTWNDADNADGVRPDTVKFQLKADGVNVGTPVEVTAGDQGNWSYTFTNLPKVKVVDGAAVDIAYTVSEVDLDANYTAGTPAYTTDDDGNVTATLENTHNRETTKVEGTKTWDDSNNVDSTRPTTVKLGVFDADDMTTAVKTVTLTTANVSDDDANVWSFSFTDLPKNKLVDGTSTEISYVVRELDGDGNALNNNSLTTNTHYTVTYDDATHAVTNTCPPEKIAVKVTKAWEDDANRDGKRPQSVTIQLVADGTPVDGKTLTLNEDNGWIGSFTDLVANRDGGTAIAYTVQEVSVNGYDTAITGTAGTGYTVTNTHETAKVSVSGTKTWDDASDQDGKRPQSVTLAVYDDDDMNTAIKTATVSAATAEADNVWSFSFTDLPKNKQTDNGTTEISYVVRELDANNGVIENNGTNGDYTVTYDGNNVTNTHTPETIDISGTKTWDDVSNQDGKRPQTIHVKVMNGATVAAENDFTGGSTDATWSYSFTGLPKYANGQVIDYTVQEDTVKDYTTTYPNGGITNSYTPGKVGVSVTKDWQDNNDQDGKRPAAVTIQLYADGQAVANKTLTLNEGNGWKDSFTNLDEMKAGQVIKYTVKEVLTDADAENYSVEVVATDNAAADGAHYAYKVTNTHEIEKTSVTVTKKWNDRDNKENKRPESIQVQLLANGQAQGAPATIEADRNGNWTYTFAGLDAYAGGQKVEYTVAELQVDKYDKAAVTGDATNGYTLTNNESTRRVVITKVDDEGNLVSGAKLQITGTDNAGQDIAPISWTTEMTAHEMQLRPGQYVLSEVQAADGYEVADPINFTVNEDGTITSADGIVSGDDLNIVSMVDEFTQNSLAALKINASDEPLAGAKMQITGKEASGKEIAPITWTSSSDPYEFQLPMGEYVLSETEAPAGYDKIADVSFTVDAHGIITVTKAEDNQAVVERGITLVAADALTQHDTSFSKVDAGGTPIEGAKLQITGTDNAGQDIAPITWTSGTTPENIKLPMGTYKFHEEAAPNGYIAVTDIVFTVDAAGKITVTDTRSNAMTVAEDGTVVITDQLAAFDVKVAKVDGDGKLLAGAELQVSGTDAAGQKVDAFTWVSSADAPAMMSLAAGKYTLHEVKVPDADKYKLAADIEFEVTLNGDVVVNGKKVDAATITMVDEFVPQDSATSPAKMFLHKTGDPLSVATLLALLAGSAGLMVLLRRKSNNNEK